MPRLSFNQEKQWSECRRRWFYRKVAKLPDSGDKSYAVAGSAVHDALEVYYTLKHKRVGTYAEWEAAALAKFHETWKKDPPRLGNQEYIAMMYAGMKARDAFGNELDLTSCELQIFFSDFLGFLDGYDSFYEEDGRKGLIIDWKTSKLGRKDYEYTQQLISYAWLHYRKFGYLPARCTVYYLRDMSKPLTIVPTMDQIRKYEEQVKTSSAQIDHLIQFSDDPSKFQRVSMTQDAQVCFWCPYKAECAKADSNYSFTIKIVGDKIKILGKLPEKLDRMLDMKMSYKLKDAYWVAKRVMAKTGRRYDGVVHLWKKNACPIGYKAKLYYILSQWAQHLDKKLSLTVHDTRTPLKQLPFFPEKIEGFTLYEHQQEAVDAALRGKLCTIQVPTGGGKTLICAEIMRRLGGKALFVIDNKDLLWQTKEEYENLLGFECGIVGAGSKENDWDKPIVCATVQALTRNLAEYKDELAKFHVLIADEVSNWGAKSYKLLSARLLNTHYRIGCSGTVYRDDGNTELIFAYVGDLAYKVTTKELQDKGLLMEPQTIFLQYEANAAKLQSEYEEYKEAYEELVVDHLERNEAVLGAAYKAVDSGKKILLVSRRVKHCRLFHEALESKYGAAALIYGKTSDEDRESRLADFKSGKIKILVGNISIFAKGINVPDLDVIINAAGNKGDVVTMQSIGRVMRVAPGKKQPIYLDFDDKGSFAIKHAHARKKALSAHGYRVDVEKLDDWKL